MYLPLQKLLGQSLSVIQNPPGPVEYVLDVEILSPFLRAENAAYASAKHTHHFKNFV